MGSPADPAAAARADLAFARALERSGALAPSALERAKESPAALGALGARLAARFGVRFAPDFVHWRALAAEPPAAKPPPSSIPAAARAALAADLFAETVRAGRRAPARVIASCTPDLWIAIWRAIEARFLATLGAPSAARLERLGRATLGQHERWRLTCAGRLWLMRASLVGIARDPAEAEDAARALAIEAARDGDPPGQLPLFGAPAPPPYTRHVGDPRDLDEEAISAPDALALDLDALETGPDPLAWAIEACGARARIAWYGRASWLSDPARGEARRELLEHATLLSAVVWGEARAARALVTARPIRPKSGQLVAIGAPHDPIEQRVWQSREDAIIDPQPGAAARALCARLRAAHPALGAWAAIERGPIPSGAASPEPISGARACLGASEISPFYTSSEPRWAGDPGGLEPPEERVVVRATGRGLIAAIAPAKIVSLDTLYELKRLRCDARYALAFLGSGPLAWYLRTERPAPPGQRPEIALDALAELPLPAPDLESEEGRAAHDALVEAARSLEAARAEVARAPDEGAHEAAIERARRAQDELDRLVAERLGLEPKEWSR